MFTRALLQCWLQIGCREVFRTPLARKTRPVLNDTTSNLSLDPLNSKIYDILVMVITTVQTCGENMYTPLSLDHEGIHLWL